MSKLFKRSMTLLLVVIMMAALFAACSSNNTNNNNNSSNNNSSNNSSSNNNNNNNNNSSSNNNNNENQPAIAAKSLDEWMAEDAANPIDITVYRNQGNAPIDDNPTFRLIKEMTGVNLRFWEVDGSMVEQKLNLMLATQEYPDIINFGNVGATYQKYVEAGDLLDLWPLLRDWAPTYVYLNDECPEENGALLTYRTNENGELFILTGGYENLTYPGQVKVSNPFDPRWEMADIYAKYEVTLLWPVVQEFCDKLIETTTEYYDLLVAYKAKYPNNYPLSLFGNGNSQFFTVLGTYGYLFPFSNTGGAAFVTMDRTDLSKFVYAWQAPEALDSLKFLNRLYREGLMDQDGPLQGWEPFYTKGMNAQIFSLMGFWDEITFKNQFPSTEDYKDYSYIHPRLAQPGVTRGVEKNYASLGVPSCSITVACKYPERFIRFLEYHFNYDELLMGEAYGRPGEVSSVDDSGWYYFTPENLQNINDYYENGMNANMYLGFRIFNMFITRPQYSSIGQWTNSSREQNYTRALIRGETNADRNAEWSFGEIDQAVNNSPFNWRKNYIKANCGYVDYSLILDFALSADGQEIQQKINSYTNDQAALIMMANSEAEVERMYNETISTIEGMGVSQWMDEMRSMIQGKRDKLGM